MWRANKVTQKHRKRLLQVAAAKVGSTTLAGWLRVMQDSESYANSLFPMHVYLHWNISEICWQGTRFFIPETFCSASSLCFSVLALSKLWMHAGKHNMDLIYWNTILKKTAIFLQFRVFFPNLSCKKQKSAFLRNSWHMEQEDLNLISVYFRKMLQDSCQVYTFMQKFLPNTSKLQMTVRVNQACHFMPLCCMKV